MVIGRQSAYEGIVINIRSNLNFSEQQKSLVDTLNQRKQLIYKMRASLAVIEGTHEHRTETATLILADNILYTIRSNTMLLKLVNDVRRQTN